MKKQNETKLFAFKLAKKVEQVKADPQWKVRDDVATAGCTFPSERYASKYSKDGGVYC